MRHNRASTATIALATLGGADLVATIGLLKNGGQEANPLFATILELGGLPAMIAFKLLSLGIGIFALEKVRLTRPDLAERVTWGIVAIYLLLLALHVRRTVG